MEPTLADLSHLHAVVALRSLAEGKARMGAAIDAEERETLLRGLLRHTLGVLGSWPGCRAIHVVSRDPAVLDAAAEHVTASAPIHGTLQAGSGLNEALDLGRTEAARAGATAVLLLPADLPLLSHAALDRLLHAADAAVAAGSGRPVVVIVPSDARGGTNALLLSPAGAIDPGFGTRSLEAHLRSAAAADASLQVVQDPDLGFDLDEPDDLERLDPELQRELTRLGTAPAPASG